MDIHLESALKMTKRALDNCEDDTVRKKIIGESLFLAKSEKNKEFSDKLMQLFNEWLNEVL